MRRMNGVFWRDMRSHQEGASSVFVALMLVALLGFAAISIDVGKLYWEKAQLQSGADAGALAIARICGDDETDPKCISGLSVAQPLASGNANDSISSVGSISLDTSGKTVTVTTDASEVGAPPNAVSTWFARILNPSFANVEVRATSTAAWGPPSKLTAKFPLAFSKCEIERPNALDGEVRLFSSHGATDKERCDGPSSGWEIPGGFGWLVQDPAKSCSTKTFIGSWEGSLTGENNFSKGCEARRVEWFGKLSATPRQQVIALFPVFDEVRAGGSNGEFKISAYAAVEILGWNLNGNDYYMSTSGLDTWFKSTYKNSDRGFVGRFVRYVFDDEDVEFGGGGVDYGAGVVRLIK